jgi:hypothetical protein
LETLHVDNLNPMKIKLIRLISEELSSESSETPIVQGGNPIAFPHESQIS